MHADYHTNQIKFIVNYKMLTVISENGQTDRTSHHRDGNQEKVETAMTHSLNGPKHASIDLLTVSLE